MKIKVGFTKLDDEPVYFPFMPEKPKDLIGYKFIEVDFNELDETITSKWLQLKELLRYFQDLYSKARPLDEDTDMTENRLFTEASTLHMLSREAKKILAKRYPGYQEESDFIILTDMMDLLEKYIEGR